MMRVSGKDRQAAFRARLKREGGRIVKVPFEHDDLAALEARGVSVPETLRQLVREASTAPDRATLSAKLDHAASRRRDILYHIGRRTFTHRHAAARVEEAWVSLGEVQTLLGNKSGTCFKRPY
jgi:hypothetical protein